MLATTTGAQAQTWLSDRKRAQGIGIRVGDLELHPGIGTEFGYINNVYNAEVNEDRPDDGIVSTPALRVSPHLFLSTLTGERAGLEEGATPGFIQFNGGLSAALEHYFADGAPDTDFGTDIDLQLTLAPNRPVSFGISELFRRSFRPFANPATDPVSGLTSDGQDVDYVRYYESIAARLLGQTSGGLLKGGLGYRFTYEWYESTAYEENNNLSHTVDLTGAWEFLPKSALFYEAIYTHQNYTENEGDGDPQFGQLRNDNDQVSARLGFNGAVTPRISATLAAGYTAGFFDGNDFEGIIVNAEARWLPSAVSEWALGFERNFGSAYVGNFVRRHNIYTHLRMFFGGAFVLTSRLAVEFMDFGPSPSDGDQGARSDVLYSGDISGEYRFVDWLALTAQISGQIDDSDYVNHATVVVDGDEVELDDPVEYKTYEAWIGLRAFF